MKLFNVDIYRWFMPVNIGFTFLFGEILGWTIVNILKPKSYLEGLIVASSAIGEWDI